MRAAHRIGAGLLALAGAGALGLLLLDEPAPATIAPDRSTPAAARVRAPEVALAAATPSPAASDVPDAADAAVPTRLDLRPGDVREAAFRYDSRLVLGGEQGQVEAMSTSIAGQLTLTCYAADERGLLVGQRWAAATAALEGQEVSRDALMRDLGAEVLVRLDRRGAVLGVALPARASTEARNLVRALVGVVSVVLPAGPVARWQAPGVDPIGPCVDVYDLRATAAEGAVVDRARRFTALHGADAGLEASVEGGLTLTIAPDGLTARVSGREVVGLGGPEASVAMRLVTTASLERTGARALSQRDLARAHAAAEAGLGAWSVGLAPEVDVDPASARVARAEPRDLETLVTLLTHAFPEGGELEVGPEAPRLFLELAERLRREDGAVSRAVDLARGATLPTGVRATVIDALGEAGTAAAQRALVALARDARVQDDVAPNVFLSLAEPTAPLPEVVATLEVVAAGRDALRAEWATQGLGILAGKSDDATLADRLAAGLEQALGRGAESDRVVLEALGNAGRPRSAEAIFGYTQVEDDELRATAVSALRQLAGEPVDAAIARALDDGSEVVRREALRVLAARGPATAQASVAQVLQRDPEPLVRLDALEVVAGWLSDADAPVEALRALVKRSASSDPAADVRDAAAAALAGA